jgi:hypothetical protein
MMFASIFLRINQYGYTENRYLIVILGLWVTGVMAYFATRKFNRNIIVPISLAFVIFISSFGPFSSISVSIRSQNRRFEKILVNNGMLLDGALTPNPNLSLDNKKEISNIISYFMNMHDLNKLAILPDGFRVEDMPAVLGFEYQPQYHIPTENYFYFYSDLTQQPIRVKDYDYYFAINSWNTDRRTIDNVRVDMSVQALTLTVWIGTEDPVQIDMTPMAEEVFNKYAQNILQERNMVIPVEDMTFIGETNRLRYSITFSNISGYSNADGSLVYENLDLILLLGLK